MSDSMLVPSDDDIDFARNRWLRDLSVLMVFRVDANGEGLELFDRWRAALLPIFLAGGWTPLSEILFVPKTPGAADVRSVRLARGRTFAEAAARFDEIAGGSCSVLMPGSHMDHTVNFSVWPAPSDPEEHLQALDFTLTCTLRELDPALRERLMTAADAFASDTALVHGQVGAAVGTKTALLRTHRRSLGRAQAWQRHYLIGYDWVTYVPTDLAAKVAPRRLQHAGERLFSVSWMGPGTLRLQATERPEDYDTTAVRNVFESLVDILPDGVPDPEPTGSVRRPWLWDMLCYEDPANFR